MRVSDLSDAELEQAMKTAKAAWWTAYLESIRYNIVQLLEVRNLIEAEQHADRDRIQAEVEAKFEREQRVQN